VKRRQKDQCIPYASYPIYNNWTKCRKFYRFIGLQPQFQRRVSKCTRVCYFTVSRMRRNNNSRFPYDCHKSSLRRGTVSGGGVVGIHGNARTSENPSPASRAALIFHRRYQAIRACVCVCVCVYVCCVHVRTIFRINTERTRTNESEISASLFPDYSWECYARKDLCLYQDVIIRSSKHCMPQLVGMIEIANCCSASPLERSTSAYGYRPHGFNPCRV